MGIKNLVKKILPSFVVNACAYAQSQRAQRTALKKNCKMIKMLLKGNCPIKLELGAGQDRGMEGWTSVDMRGYISRRTPIQLILALTNIADTNRLIIIIRKLIISITWLTWTGITVICSMRKIF